VAVIIVEIACRFILSRQAIFISGASELKPSGFLPPVRNPAGTKPAGQPSQLI